MNLQGRFQVACLLIASLGMTACSNDDSAPGANAGGGGGALDAAAGGGGSAGASGSGGASGAGGMGGTGGASGGGGTSGAGGSAGSGGATCPGTALEVAPDIELCLPPVVCNAETCPPPLGDCVSGKCVYKAGYEGLATLPEAWATYYCQLSTGGCHGVTQLEFPEVTAGKISAAMGLPLCESPSGAGTACVGIAASSPMLVGNSQLAVDPSTSAQVTNWGLGLTEASGLCYEVTGPGGTAIVALTDRCGGYCQCAGSGYQECGPCVNATDMQPNCACVGTVPGLFGECCGLGCSTTEANCDWCASNNHPHFDLDTGTFQHVCGDQANQGSCRLSKARYVPCMAPEPGWPPGGSAGACKANSFNCNGTAAPHQDTVPGTSCCCGWDLCPQSDGTCAAAASPCKAGSCACGAGMPDASHPQVASTGCCCLAGLAPQADGTCQ